MKRTVCIIMFTISILVFACSCSKNDGDEANYYVRYSVSARSSAYAINFATEDDVEVYHVTTSSGYSRTCGPVRKGFKASINSSCSDGNVYIYVCKNSEPFVLKAYGRSSASYIIDF